MSGLPYFEVKVWVLGNGVSVSDEEDADGERSRRSRACGETRRVDRGKVSPSGWSAVREVVHVGPAIF